jgi:hypothetical protein
VHVDEGASMLASYTQLRDKHYYQSSQVHLTPEGFRVSETSQTTIFAINIENPAVLPILPSACYGDMTKVNWNDEIHNPGECD